MSHTEQESAHEALRRHFASRVANQVRNLLDRWRLLNELKWDTASFDEFERANEKLLRQAARFEADMQLRKAMKIEEIIKQIRNASEPASSKQITELAMLINALGETAQRRDDASRPAEKTIPLRKPVYLAIDPDIAGKTSEQMRYFSIDAVVVETPEALLHACSTRLPSCLVVDVDFGNENAGLDLIEQLQKNRHEPLPVIFVSANQKSDITTRLRASRAGGVRFFPNPNISQLIRSVDKITHSLPEDPFKVLVVDDSRSQSLYAERALNAAGMVTHVINNPLDVLDAIVSFNPEMIVMDMYMPGCTGMELAAVIRQQPEYINLPIIYLSGEEDRQKQLAAMSQGGDDFLTKPVDPNHLVATVQNRGQRARALKNLIVRDSLTGLYNHTHTLERLSHAVAIARELKQPLVFCMVDIDFFKKINDNYGHPVGDKVISALSLFLKQRLRKTDVIGRYGGEEFALVLPNTREQDALHLMNTIREGFGKLEHSSDKGTFNVAFSCGISAFTGDNEDDMIEQADQALYQAKKNGRNNVQLFIPQP